MKHHRLMAVAAAGMGLVGCSSASPVAAHGTASTTPTTASPSPTTASTTPPTTPPTTGASPSATGPVGTEPPPPTATTATTGPSVQPLLLDTSDLAKGWTVNRTGSAFPVSAFPDPTGDSLVALSYAHVAFSMSGGLPGLSEDIASAYSAAAGFAVTQIIYDNTSTFTTTIDGHPASGTMHPVPAPTEGAQSAAYAATITSGAQTVHQGIVLAQKGSYVVGVALTESGNVDMGELSALVADALAKLPTAPIHATPPTVPDSGG